MGIIAITTGTNWDTFAPDMIVAATTGVFVGAVLLGAQGFTQSRRSRADSKFAWESLKPTLFGAAHRSWVQDFDNLYPIPLPLSELDAIASRSPLALWKSHMKEADPALEALLVLSRLRPQFESCATELETAMNMDSIQFLSQTWMAAQPIGRIIRARAYGEQDSAALATCANVSPSEHSTYSAAADHLLELPRLAAAMVRYREASSIFLVTLTNLRQYLAADDATV